ncbi:MAG: isoaspartyl peptidase/L-asparaginase family protein [Deltaproteobacteria bacterium]
MRPAIAVHGGAGIFGDEALPEALAGVSSAAAAGFERLRAGLSAIEAVLAAVNALEDDPAFNAGTGAVLTSEGTVEHDAAVMSGRDLSAGAVGALGGFPHPSAVAEALRRHGSHVFLVGDGAARFAIERGIGRVEPGRLVTPGQQAKWLAERARRGAGQAPSPLQKHGTVGAVAVDAHGHVAAATSTGGVFFKLPGRVGDSPVIGAGTYADDLAGAASATGQGEAILKVTLARSAIDRLRAKLPAQQAAEEAIGELTQRTQGDGGLILITPEGDIGIAFNTRRMSRARCDADHPTPQAAIER